MISAQFSKKLRLLPLLALPVLAWLLPSASEKSEPNFSPEKVNLALRRTADGLLRLAGDSTSRILAVEQTAANVWRVRLEQSFDYAQLPALLQHSLDLHGIGQPYQVAVRRCDNSAIDLGYHQADFFAKNSPFNLDAGKADPSQKSTVPCQGREQLTGCHFLEITFLENSDGPADWPWKPLLFGLFLGGLAVFWFLKRPKNALPHPAEDVGNWLEIGQSRLDPAAQILLCGGQRQALTFRETKLLRLFAARPNEVLERDFILQEVWADEGILVGRSLDVFVSRLRKKLAADKSVAIAAVHGVGYRLETGKAKAQMLSA